MRKHVLLIDDNEIDNFISEYIITKSKIAEKVSVKTSAIEALDYLKKLIGNSDILPDLIFLDIKMPIMDGFGFLEEFSKFPETINNQCSIVMLSSSSDQDDVDSAFKHHAVKKFLTKPLKIEMLENL
jgi:CheY-like chemotaxis protein